MDIFLGQNIRHLRQVEKMSLKDMAARMNVTASYISSVERGNIFPSVQNLILVVDLFNCNLHELFFKDMSTPITRIEENTSAYPQNRLAIRLEQMLSDLEERVKSQCPDCARKLNIL